MRVFDKKYLLKLKDKDYCPIEIIKGLTDKGRFQYLTKLMFPRHPANDSSKIHQFVVFELCYFKCLKLYSLNLAIAHAQIKIVMLIIIGHNCVA